MRIHVAQLGIKIAAVCFVFVALFATGCSGIGATIELQPETVDKMTVQKDSCNCGEIDQLSQYVPPGQKSVKAISFAEDNEVSLDRFDSWSLLPADILTQQYVPPDGWRNATASNDWPVTLARAHL